MSKLDNDFSFKDAVSLKEHFDAKMELYDKAMCLYREAMNKRLETMNAFRDQINRIEGTLVTRVELDLILDRFKNDKRADIATAIGIVALVISLITIYLRV